MKSQLLKTAGALMTLAGASMAMMSQAIACDPLRDECVAVVSVPEPSSLPLLAIGLATLAITLVASRGKRPSA